VSYRGRLTRAGLDYLTLLGRPAVKVRFDIVEVLLADGAVGKKYATCPTLSPWNGLIDMVELGQFSSQADVQTA